VNKSKKSGGSKWLDNLLFRFLGYFSDGMQKFVKSGQGEGSISLQSVDQFKPLILIVARRHYTELNRSYPLENRSEVKKLINLEYAGQRLYYKLAKAENGKILVNIWLIKSVVPDAWLTLPESFILSARSTLGRVLQLNTSPSQFMTKQNQLIHSQIGNQLINNANNFAMSVGIPGSFELEKIEPAVLPQMLLQNLKCTPTNELFLFFSMPSLNLTKQNFNSIIAPSVALGIIYLVLSSVYVGAHKYYLESQIAQQSEEINVALDANSQMQQQTESYQKLQKFMASQLDIAAVWYVFADVVNDVQLSRFDLIQGRFVLAGQTDRATSLLEKISNNAHVKEARFDNPTRTSKNKEFFVISFTVKPLQEKESKSTERVADASI
jgi:hypothetical protein